MTALTTPYGFSSTTAEVVHGIDLTGYRALVTGSSSGLGAETAGRWPRPGRRWSWPSAIWPRASASPGASPMRRET